MTRAADANRIKLRRLVRQAFWPRGLAAAQAPATAVVLGDIPSAVSAVAEQLCRELRGQTGVVLIDLNAWRRLAEGLTDSDLQAVATEVLEWCVDENAHAVLVLDTKCASLAHCARTMSLLTDRDWALLTVQGQGGDSTSINQLVDDLAADATVIARFDEQGQPVPSATVQDTEVDHQETGPSLMAEPTTSVAPEPNQSPETTGTESPVPVESPSPDEPQYIEIQSGGRTIRVLKPVVPPRRAASASPPAVEPPATATIKSSKPLVIPPSVSEPDSSSNSAPAASVAPKASDPHLARQRREQIERIKKMGSQ